MNYNLAQAPADFTRVYSPLGGMRPIFALVDQSTSTERANLGQGWTDIASASLSKHMYYAVVADPSSSASTGLVPMHGPWSDAGTSRNSEGQFTVLGTAISPQISAQRQQVLNNAAGISLLDSWLQEAAEGIDDEERRNLAEIKAAIDADRLSSRKLFP